MPSIGAPSPSRRSGRSWRPEGPHSVRRMSWARCLLLALPGPYARAGFGLQKVLRRPAVKIARFRRFAWLVLAATLGVILWGAYVRASGSGAGCGSHWPTCNGDVIPRAPSVATLVEFGHRA